MVNTRAEGLDAGARVMTSAILFVWAAGAAPMGYPFSGRWRIDTSSIVGDIKPTIFHLIDGGFRRDDNQVVIADGHFHPVVSDGYVDEQSISVASDHVVNEVDRIRGRLAYTVRYVVSPDNNTLTWHVANYTGPNGQAVTGETVQHRVGLPAKGAHPISGKWQRVRIAVDAKSDWLLTLDGDRFAWRRSDGTGYDAIAGGHPVKIDGDNSGARASITRPRADTVVETDISAQGKRGATLSMRMMPDRKTIRCTAVTLADQRSQTFYLRRVS